MKTAFLPVPLHDSGRESVAAGMLKLYERCLQEYKFKGDY